MKYLGAFSRILILGCSAFAFSPIARNISAAPNPVLVNVIVGTVYAPNRRPVPDLWVELQNEFNITYLRQRTGGTGRFTFSGVQAGHYEIKVYTTGTDFEEQTVSLDVVNVVQNASDTVYQDIVLKYKKGMGNTGIAQMTDTLFVQEIPDEARRLFKAGVRDLGGSLEKGREELNQAIKIFPDYYDALNALGCNYVLMKEYDKSFPYLIHAIDVNPRSFSSFYSLGYAAFKVNHLHEAGEAARASVVLQPNSVNAQLLYGTVLREDGSYDKALETLLKAEKLSKDSPVAEVHWQLALLYNKLNRNKEAADQLEIYLKIDPEVANKKQVQDLIQKLRAKPKTT